MGPHDVPIASSNLVRTNFHPSITATVWRLDHIIAIAAGIGPANISGLIPAAPIATSVCCSALRDSLNTETYEHGLLNRPIHQERREPSGGSQCPKKPLDILQIQLHLFRTLLFLNHVQSQSFGLFQKSASFIRSLKFDQCLSAECGKID